MRQGGLRSHREAASRAPRSKQRRDEPRVPPAPGLSNVSAVLSAAAQRLRAEVGCERVVAWARREDGTPFVVFAAYDDFAPPDPEPAEYEAAASCTGVTDPHDASDETLQRLARRHRCSALAPVCESEADPAGVPAVLLVGDTEPLAPTARAALDTAVRRTAAGLEAAERADRLDTGMRRLDRLAALGTLAAEIAHEVRNPLVSVKTLLRLVPERRDDPDFLARLPQIADGELRRVERLLDLVIDHAKPLAPPGAACVGEAVEAVAELLAHRAAADRVRIETRVSSNTPEVALDEDGLRQVIFNLAQNALDATPSGGAVRIRGRASDERVLVAIADEGPGIPPERRDAIFEPFVSGQRDRPGGLGLAITRRIVEEAGGEVEVVDAEGGGAEFRVSLPAAAATPPSRG